MGPGLKNCWVVSVYKYQEAVTVYSFGCKLSLGYYVLTLFVYLY